METTRIQSEARVQLEVSDMAKIDLLGLTICPVDWVGPRHAHLFWEIVYIKSEPNQSYTYEIGNQFFHCTEPALFLIPPNTVHQFHNTGAKPLQNLYIGFTFNFSSSMQLKSDLPIMIPRREANSEYVKATLNEILHQSFENAEQVFQYKRIDILLCMLHIIRWMVVVERNVLPVDTPHALQITQSTKEYISAHLDRHISIQELSKQFYLSPNYLGQVFRQTTGMTLKAYHNHMRMGYAYALLSEGIYSVGDVAMKLGFDNIAYFSRRFKAFYGFPPSHVSPSSAHSHFTPLTAMEEFSPERLGVTPPPCDDDQSDD